MRIELVTWKDASADESGWEKPDAIIDSDVIIESTGWVVKSGESRMAHPRAATARD